MNLQYSGEERIPVSPDVVWAFVTDPDKVGHCMPEVIDVTVQDPTHVEAVVQVAVGPVRGKFKLKVELQPDPARRRIDLKISGGGFGSAVDMTAGADVVDAGDGTTILKWSGQAVARGPVAAVGGRVLDAQAQKLITQAFGNVRQQLSLAT
ncbi:MAG: carbon monoxide dehydrogenase [Acidobacteria bacterium 13_1_40CM_65_14]|nr:MAG: carbon monoxide dehydrogenase [Acidobacteria bacterium 13_1_40CM_65_14]OLE84590.1 MAG: carbon monoxide dehydrogenase [Acidobacteria bacterium 13_1_20CM_2_65_9]